MLLSLRSWLYLRLLVLRRFWLRRVWGMTIGEGVRISGKAQLDYTNPRGIHVGDFTLIAPGARVFTHDWVTCRRGDTRIGSHCFIGANAVVLCGVTIGDRCVIAAGAVVNRDVPERSLVAGNPARVVRSGIRTGQYGRTVVWAKDFG